MNGPSDPEFRDSICRPGEGAATCSYLTLGDGFECAKSSPTLYSAIEARRPSMAAQGDNCSGFPMFTPSGVEQPI